MARRRALRLPEEATNEGSRQLRKILRRQGAGWIARRLLCDERTARRYADEAQKPSLQMRARAQDVFGIPERAWDEEPTPDAYEDGSPSTTRRA